VIPVGSRRQQQLLIVTRHGDEWIERSDGGCIFVPLLGEAGWGEERPAILRSP
jgi:protein-L-isoaspartate O-methyltransferase